MNKHVAPVYPWCQSVLATKPPVKVIESLAHSRSHEAHRLGNLAPVGLGKKVETCQQLHKPLRRQYHANVRRGATSPTKTTTPSTAFCTQPPSLAVCHFPASEPTSR